MRTLTRSALGILVIVLAGAAQGQYLCLDVTGDGEHSAREVVDEAAPNVVDVWIRTDQNRDGSGAAAIDRDRGPLTINSYELALRAEGGTVEWLEYLNLQPTMAVPFGTCKSPTEFRVGFGGPKALPPGRHRLGRLKFRVTSGSPSIEVVPRSNLSPRFRTSFGSRNLGIDGDYTLKLGSGGRAENGESKSVAMYGDWTDVDGLSAGGTAREATSRADSISVAVEVNGAAAVRFGATVLRSGLSAFPSLRVATTKPGRLRVRIFEPSGRIVATLANEAQASASVREFRVGSAGSGRVAPASGVYFYRIEAEEGTLTGRFVVIK